MSGGEDGHIPKKIQILKNWVLKSWNYDCMDEKQYLDILSNILVPAS